MSEPKEDNDPDTNDKSNSDVKAKTKKDKRVKDIDLCLFGSSRAFYFTNTVPACRNSLTHLTDISVEENCAPISLELGDEIEDEDDVGGKEDDDNKDKKRTVSFEQDKHDKMNENDHTTKEYYDAKKRLGPSMNCVENKISEIRSLTSRRRLDDFQPRIIEEVDQKQLSQKTHVIDIFQLRRLSSMGIVDKGSHRGVVWRVLLGYLPLELNEWERFLKRERELYRQLVNELFVQPSHQITLPQEVPIGTKIVENDSISGNSTRLTPKTTQSATLEDGCHLRNELSQSDLAPLKEIMRIRSQRQFLLPQDSASSLRSKDGDNTDGLLEAFEEIDHERVAQRRQLTSNNPLPLKSCDEIPPTHYTPEMTLIPQRILQEHRLAGTTPPTDTTNSLHTSFDRVDDNPLSLDNDSKWAQFFENARLLDEIRKDVVRTHPDLHFFLEPERNLGQRRYAALERILFVWAKLNHGVRYVQGMNEIVGTIYFVLATDFNEEWACEAEADAYFLFNTLMNEMRDVFIPDLDEADTGIQGRIGYFKSLLSLHDPEIRCHLDDLGIDASFYAVRWLTTLLSREFLLPDTIRLWDSMFASTHKDNFLRYVCVTMVMTIREKLLKGDFSTCLRLLQSYPATDVAKLLEASRALWIYESQVTLACHRGGITLEQALNTITPPSAILMAYGLKGGIANKSHKVKEFGDRAKTAVSSSRHSILSTGGSGKNFFGQFFGSKDNISRTGSDSSEKDKELTLEKQKSEVKKHLEKQKSEDKKNWYKKLTTM